MKIIAIFDHHIERPQVMSVFDGNTKLNELFKPENFNFSGSILLLRETNIKEELANLKKKGKK